MFTVTTDTELFAPNIQDLDIARATAEQFAASGYAAAIRYDATGEIVERFEVPTGRDSDPQAWLDHINAHPDDHPARCVPYVDAAGECFLVLRDGKAAMIDAPGITSVRGDELCDFDSDLGALAETVNPDFERYPDHTDQQVALMAMRETGCAACPFNLECDGSHEFWVHA